MNVKFKMPVNVIMEENCVQKEADLLTSFGKRAIVITDGIAAVRNGAMDDITAVLNKKNVEFVIYDHIESNPTVECAREATKLAREFRAEFIIAIGGGSSLDVGKAVSLMITQGRELSDEDMLTGNFCHETIPLVALPTTSGTGSEVTPFSMLTSHATNRKINLNSPTMYARLALLDSNYTLTVPYTVTVNTALDALSHAIEAMITVTSTPLIRAIARESLAGANQVLLGLREDDLSNIALRDVMMYDSVLAGIAVGQTRTSALHGLSYSLTVHRHIAHGRAVGLLMVPYLRFTRNKKPILVDQVIEAMGLRNLDDLEKGLKILLGEKDVFSEEEIQLWATEASALRNIKNCIVPPTREDLIDILQAV